MLFLLVVLFVGNLLIFNFMFLYVVLYLLSAPIPWQSSCYLLNLSDYVVSVICLICWDFTCYSFRFLLDGAI